MPEFKDLPAGFRCPHRDGCPYLQGLSTGWLQVEGSQPQLERIREGTRVDVNLPEVSAPAVPTVK